MECLACIHCHFYQPPRENPWLEAVESQGSASPQHDWNERIARECYLPNGASRILDSQHRIAKIVNNYARISFNFGPTLLSWMEERAPEGYERILAGDRESQTLYSGHGSALAQAYNHTILPLSNSRDKRTQILWGIRDFQDRFKRDPEGMWLPETAVDTETLEILSDNGIEFTILAPRQADQVRVDNKSPWAALEYGIDSRRAYACNLPSGRSIGLFFYDGSISTAVAFERLLHSGENFARRLLSRFDPKGDSAELMHIATDGETYGHHHRHGDMALAYALEYIQENRLAKLTNYGEYFELHPPTQEVLIKERSSWSCAHGVGRWENDCGCNAGTAGWSQNWRRPLREAFDWLRDDLIPAFEQEAQTLFNDPWKARDEYINIILDRSCSSVDCFFANYAARDLTSDKRVHALRLLEMQRHLMLMYTSCGWFFDEPTGPETVQVLQYASRAVQLGQQLFGGEREEQFLKRLEAVRSNIPESGNGRDIYERFVRPAMLDLPGVAAHYAISSFFDGYRSSDSVYSYSAELSNAQICQAGKLKLAAGRACIISYVTRADFDFDFVVLYGGGQNLRAGIADRHPDFPAFLEHLLQLLSQQDFEKCSQRVEEYFGPGVYSLKSLFRDERRRIVGQIVDAALANIDGLYSEVYGEHAALIGFLRELHIALPPILRVSSEFVLSNELRRCLCGDGLDIARVRVVLETATRQGINLDGSLKMVFRERVDELMNRWAQDPLQPGMLAQLVPLVTLIRDTRLEADLWNAQNKYFEVLGRLDSFSGALPGEQWLRHFHVLGDVLGIAVPSTEETSSAEIESVATLSGLPNPDHQGLALNAPMLQAQV